MGTLQYGDSRYELHDRVLAHIQFVVGVKLRRRENFFLSWSNPVSSGRGRQSLWIDNGIHLGFEYSDVSAPAISRDWAEALAASAQTNFGLQITDEHGNLINVERPQASS